MAQATINRVIEEIRSLQPDDLRTVERTVRELLAPTAREAEREATLRILQESGLVREIKRPPMIAHQEAPPVSIQGKPLSETIIEERQ